ncbi:hypothetical protein [Mesorhizobium sp. M2A.F.Ca.ET.037.01.1.1]|nr:hypothetical protein [Mesorhizobium sp. M2A.F.Ca.ET.037.01.1.1]TIV14628.1 MAG: hypothetical protein E5V95_29585 [Mesorhizobium sp.]
MNFSIAGIIRRLLAPQHELSVSRKVWQSLVNDLRDRGRERSRESGAFLLGKRSGGTARITNYILYDNLDPSCLDTGIVRFNGAYYGALWEACETLGLDVVADIHVHPYGEGQSDSDRNHPMISQPGHIALILPNFADEPVAIPRVGIYRYLGGKKWSAVQPAARPSFFLIV